MTASVIDRNLGRFAPDGAWLVRRPTACMTVTAIVAAVVVGIAARTGPVEGCLAVVAIAVCLEVFRRPALGALLLVAAVPITAGLRRGFPVPSVRPSELLVITLAPLVIVAVGRRDGIRWRTLDWLLLAYVVATAVLGTYNVVRRGETMDASMVGKLLSPLQFLLLLRATSVALVTPALRRNAVRLVFLASVPVALLALLQQLNVAGTRVWLARVLATDIFDSPSYSGFSRATSVFPHWNTLAGYEFLIVLLGVGLLLVRGQRTIDRRLLVGVLALNGAALLLSATIAAAFGVVAGTFALGAWHGRIRNVVTWLLCAAAVAFVLFGSFLLGRFDQQYEKSYSVDQHPLIPHSVAMRIEIWKDDYLPAVSGRLAAGYGPDIPPEVRWGFTESLYITLLLRGGLPLLCIFVALVLAWIAALRRYVDDPDPDRRTLARVIAVAVLALVPMHFVFPYLANSGLSHLIWALTGVALAGAGAHELEQRVGDALSGASVPQGRAPVG